MIRGALGDDRGSYRLWQAAREAIIGSDSVGDFRRARGSWLDAIFSIIAFEQAFDIRVAALGVDTPPKAAAKE